MKLRSAGATLAGLLLLLLLLLGLAEDEAREVRRGGLVKALLPSGGILLYATETPLQWFEQLCGCMLGLRNRGFFLVQL